METRCTRTRNEAAPRLRSEVARGIVGALPVLAAVIAYGLVLGAQAVQKGLHFLEVPLMTGSNYAGGSEFAAIGLWASPPPVLLIVGITFLINSRHLLMGAVLTPFIRHLPRWKALSVLFFMSDESWALGYADTLRRAGTGQRPPFSLGFYVGCAGVIYLGWLGSTTLGAAIGPHLGDVEAYGFDMAFPAVFLVIVAGMWKGYVAALPWLVSLAVAVLIFLLVPGAWFVVAGTAAGLGTAYCRAKPR
ncbi:MAG TPA: AzlC family ABC transporter permease [Geminicoccus sp.]|uniref:AzlC family ABC transporter permease n=1 Tax=Geminicoccus sp. TaxID=2024832 RepID=UPI002E37E9B9|nr:AzlC family ABC transporter permease [Geminicoccus sp.]HEX2527994.1 AzlC family ABC transporter permease [Geminicoccus sp.]